VTVKVNHPTVPTSPRNYSLSDRPGVEHYRITVKREPGLAPGAPDGLISNYLHDTVHRGDILELGPPCGEFTLDPASIADRPIVLLSGGIGITPLISMFKSLAHHGTDVPIHFIHAARDSRVHALANEVRRIAAELPNARTHFRYDAPQMNDVAEQRCDSVGIVDDDFIRDWLPDNDAEFYFCGPIPFMASVFRALRDRGVHGTRMHFEFFGPKQELESRNIAGHSALVRSNRVGKPVGSATS
jgi:nitric oxide dioxygenase